MEAFDLELIRLQSIADTLFFTRYCYKQRYNRKFVVNWHHKLICEHLDKVFAGEIKRLAIRIAPRYGKTELAVKNTIAKGLAINPASKFIHLSYSSDLALDNSEEVREFIQEPFYRELFPYVEIDKASTAKKKWYTTQGGGVYATATGGQITGFGAGEMDEELGVELDSIESGVKFSGAIIIDDPLKPDDADSDIKRERVNERFENTIRSRTNSRNTPIIIIGQAVHERDLIGYLMETEPEEWTLLTLPAIYQDEHGKDTALWEFKHTLEELYKLRDVSERTFNTQYQQDPQDALGLLCPLQGLTIGNFPDDKHSGSYAFADPADTGGDKLSVVFVKVHIEGKTITVFVHDVVHTNLGIEASAPIIHDKMQEHEVEEIYVESNGLGLALVLQLKNIIENKSRIKPTHSKDPKEVRIFRNYEFINKNFAFREDYKARHEYNSFMHDLTTFKREGTNTHKKDALDVSCYAAEVLKIKYRQIIYG
jgi:hypothetical protein